MSTLGERIAQRLNEVNMSQSELAKRVGVSRGAVYQWIAGLTKNLKSDVAQKTAEALEVSVEWLVTGKGTQSRSNVIALENEETPPDGFVQIPEFKINFGAGSCGEPTFEEIHDAAPATYRAEYFKHKGIKAKNCKRFVVEGDSMEPLILDGDRILVNCAPVDKIIDNHIYVFIYEDTLRVKRLAKLLDGSLLVRSENPSFKDAIISPEDAERFVHIIGEVIERSGSVLK